MTEKEEEHTGRSRPAGAGMRVHCADGKAKGRGLGAAGRTDSRAVLGDVCHSVPKDRSPADGAGRVVLNKFERREFVPEVFCRVRK